jgi:hypothetical protein
MPFRARGAEIVKDEDQDNNDLHKSLDFVARRYSSHQVLQLKRYVFVIYVPLETL